ncbi:MAG: 4Fe-4S ferredoxin [Dysgonomonas sp.]|nr:4Fe-4S ferredoxin [Dysgonomonas sp.]
MMSKNVNLVYFSATNTTKSVLESIAKGTGRENVIQYDTTNGQKNEVAFDHDDLIIFGFPVYSGRIPSVSKDTLDKFRGKNTPAIIVCVYGNRDYDDALLELRDIVSANGFAIISAGAFIGQHSIFPKVGLNRPDIKDKEKAEKFGLESVRRLGNIDQISTISEIEVKGNLPYKIPKSVPLVPKGDKKCDGCGKCLYNIIEK